MDFETKLFRGEVLFLWQKTVKHYLKDSCPEAESKSLRKERKKMPKVGSKKFAYTPKGEQAAKSYAKKSGKKLVMTKSQAAQKAQSGADMGKPGKNFATIANKIGGAKGKRVAGAIFQKLRRKGKL